MTDVIGRLTKHVAVHLHSAPVLNSMSNVVVQLIFRAARAGASRIEVQLDAVRGHCTVEDDGCGLSRDELASISNVAKSASANPGCWSRLELFSALSHLCLLTVISKHTDQYSTNAIVWRHGRIVREDFPARSWDCLLLSKLDGNRVTVQDLLGYLPARSQRAYVDDQKLVKDVEHGIIGTCLASDTALSVKTRYLGSSGSHFVELAAKHSKIRAE